MIYADTNIFIDLLSGDPDWQDWSRVRIDEALGGPGFVTGPIVMAELARHVDDVEALQALADSFGATVEPWSLDASFEAGRAFARYRAAGGTRRTILPDLLTGGHAAALRATVLTRDPRRFRAYFPDLELITPEGHP